MVVEVLHPSRANVSKSDLNEKLAGIYKVDKTRVVTFGFRTQFGGGRSTGFALIYDDEASQRKFEPTYRLLRSGLVEKKIQTNRKLRKERKNRAKKVCIVAFSLYKLVSDLAHSTSVPRDGEGESRRALQEEVNYATAHFYLLRRVLPFPPLILCLPTYLAPFHSPQPSSALVAPVSPLLHLSSCAYYGHAKRNLHASPLFFLMLFVELNL